MLRIKQSEKNEISLGKGAGAIRSAWDYKNWFWPKPIIQRGLVLYSEQFISRFQLPATVINGLSSTKLIFNC